MTVMNAIYLDHAATTPIHPEVIDVMTTVMKETFGNPSSVHIFGREARKLLDEARRTAAQSIGAMEKEIIFTSGGTESDNLALFGVAEKYRKNGNHIITTKMEHHAILHTCEQLEKNGYQVTYLDTDESGRISVQDLQQALTDQTILVSIMMVNNETGMIQPIMEIGEVLKNHQAFFHTDAVQAYGILPIDVKDLGVDLLSVSSHKINGPKGVGFLYVNNQVSLKTQQFGGEQERKRRAGTENIPGIVGFQKAIELSVIANEQRRMKYEAYNAQFIDILEKSTISFSINGEEGFRVPTIVNISFPGTNVEQLLMNLDLQGIAASSGSACTAGSVEPSHVLSAMYKENHPCTTNSIRFSFGLANTNENIAEAAQKVVSIVERLTSR